MSAASKAIASRSLYRRSAEAFIVEEDAEVAVIFLIVFFPLLFYTQIQLIYSSDLVQVVQT